MVRLFWEPSSNIGHGSRGPDRVGINTIAYYQTFLDGRLELKMGYLRNINEFAGTVVGGNAAVNVFGASSNILYQAGMSNNAAPTPGLNLKYNFDDRFYMRMSIQRSLSPDGQFAHITENPDGLDWTTTNAGVLLLDCSIRRSRELARTASTTWQRTGNSGSLMPKARQFVASMQDFLRCTRRPS